MDHEESDDEGQAPLNPYANDNLFGKSATGKGAFGNAAMMMALSFK